MKEENLMWTKNTNVTEKQLKCSCGKEANILHCSNWHDGTGVFYVECECGKGWNVRWRTKIK